MSQRALLLVFLLGDWHADEMNPSFTCQAIKLLRGIVKNNWPSFCFSTILKVDGFYLCRSFMGQRSLTPTIFRGEPAKVRDVQPNAGVERVVMGFRS